MLRDEDKAYIHADKASFLIYYGISCCYSILFQEERALLYGLRTATQQQNIRSRRATVTAATSFRRAAVLLHFSLMRWRIIWRHLPLILMMSFDIDSAATTSSSLLLAWYSHSFSLLCALDWAAIIFAILIIEGFACAFLRPYCLRRQQKAFALGLNTPTLLLIRFDFDADE